MKLSQYQVAESWLLVNKIKGHGFWRFIKVGWLLLMGLINLGKAMLVLWENWSVIIVRDGDSGENRYPTSKNDIDTYAFCERS